MKKSTEKNLIRKILACTLATALLTGCGWQMRGSKNIATNIDALTINASSAYGKMSRALQQEMRLQHIADAGSQAWNLQILDEKLEENIVAFSDANNAATYEIELQVRFSVSNHKGETVIAPNTERVVRIYEANDNRRLAMDREKDLLTTEVHTEMAANLLRRIDFIAKQK
jgi:LPS-assembly lipoprotein